MTTVQVDVIVPQPQWSVSHFVTCWVEDLAVSRNVVGVVVMRNVPVPPLRTEVAVIYLTQWFIIIAFKYMEG
jgi:hypothetical protein